MNLMMLTITVIISPCSGIVRIPYTGMLGGSDAPDCCCQRRHELKDLYPPCACSAASLVSPGLLNASGGRVHRPLMEAHAHAVAASGGDVLNVGFGLGLVDEVWCPCLTSLFPTPHTPLLRVTTHIGLSGTRALLLIADRKSVV